MNSHEYPPCPKCGYQPTSDAWLRCPKCHTELNRPPRNTYQHFELLKSVVEQEPT